MNRRAFISRLTFGLLAAPLAAEAQQVKTSRIGFLSYSSTAAYAPHLAEHRQAPDDPAIRPASGGSGD